ncbi:MAG: hypothetical protein C0525_00565 [Flavobacterium sp.]|uniref:hypothetical protein n=1 Tax=Flavobacterium sp. TaxID=239 RepID=UPI0025C3704B|nr:hypothetical protein [Flavobacterium sp.]MBA4133191.1 hypothetical protein [Flavobacterium sp.]
MEKDQWIQTVMNSTNGISAVTPSDDLLARIQLKIKQQEKVTPTTVWWIAASIAVLLTLNVALLQKAKTRDNSTSSYLEHTLNQSNQLY